MEKYAFNQEIFSLKFKKKRMKNSEKNPHVLLLATTTFIIFAIIN